MDRWFCHRKKLPSIVDFPDRHVWWQQVIGAPSKIWDFLPHLLPTSSPPLSHPHSPPPLAGARPYTWLWRPRAGAPLHSGHCQLPRTEVQHPNCPWVMVAFREQNWRGENSNKKSEVVECLGLSGTKSLCWFWEWSVHQAEEERIHTCTKTAGKPNTTNRR